MTVHLELLEHPVETEGVFFIQTNFRDRRHHQRGARRAVEFLQQAVPLLVFGRRRLDDDAIPRFVDNDARAGVLAYCGGCRRRRRAGHRRAAWCGRYGRRCSRFRSCSALTHDLREGGRQIGGIDVAHMVGNVAAAAARRRLVKLLRPVQGMFEDLLVGGKNDDRIDRRHRHDQHRRGRGRQRRGGIALGSEQIDQTACQLFGRPEHRRDTHAVAPAHLRLIEQLDRFERGADGVRLATEQNHVAPRVLGGGDPVAEQRA